MGGSICGRCQGTGEWFYGRARGGGLRGVYILRVGLQESYGKGISGEGYGEGVEITGAGVTGKATGAEGTRGRGTGLEQGESAGVVCGNGKWLQEWERGT
jgi:hypothetical protein